MTPLWGFFNLGLAELLVLAGLLLAVPLIAGVVVLIVLRATRKKDDPGNE